MICELPPGAWYGAAGGAWGADQTIIFTTGASGLMMVSAQGGDPVSLLEPDPNTEDDYHHVEPLPDGRGVVFVVHRLGGVETVDTIAVYADGKKKYVLTLEGQGVSNPVWSPTGHILFERWRTNPGVWALPFSLSSLAPTGEPFLVAPEGYGPSVTADATLAYLAGAGRGTTQLVWLDRLGEVVGTIGRPQTQSAFPSLSPDGRLVLVIAEESFKHDLWIHDAVRGTKTRLSSAEADTDPRWSPRGDHIVFSADEPPSSRLNVMAADGTGEIRDLGPGYFAAYSPDGTHLVYTLWSEETRSDLWYLPLQGAHEPALFLRTPSEEYYPRLSPDSRVLAYISNESGQDEVYLKRFSSGEGKWQVSVEGGHWPHWNGKGDRLFYAKENEIFEVEVEAAGDSLLLSTPRKLFTRPPGGEGPILGRLEWPQGFDVTPDGERFVVAASGIDKQAGEEGIAVVQNWFAEFKGKL